MRAVFLGTGSCSPTIFRSASSLALQLDDGCVWLFDCGEGTQVQFQKSSIRVGKLNKIFITHLHGDHLFGLPGLLCTLSMQVPDHKSEFVLDIYGPLGLRKYIHGFLDLCRDSLLYRFRITELDFYNEQIPESWKEKGHWPLPRNENSRLLPNELPGRVVRCDSNHVWSLVDEKNASVEASWVAHLVPCWGYVIKEKEQPGKLKVQKLKALGVAPGPRYAELRKGKAIITDDGITIEPADVLGPSTRGRKVVIVGGDTSDASALLKLGKDADFLVHEASHCDSFKERAVSRGHSTARMAVEFSKMVRSKVLVLTHFSRIYSSLGSETGEKRLEEIQKDAQNAMDSFPCKLFLAEDLEEFQIAQNS